MTTPDTMTPETPTRTRRSHLRRPVITLLIVALLGLGAYLAIKPLTAPAVGTIVATNDQPFTTPPAPQIVPFIGTYLTFSHPDTYSLQLPDQQSPGSLEQHTFRASGKTTVILTLAVTSLPSGSIDDDSSYAMRRQHPETYVLQSQQIRGEKLVLAASKSEAQQSVFWVHGSAGLAKLLTMSISGGQVTTAENADLQQILASVVWK